MQPDPIQVGSRPLFCRVLWGTETRLRNLKTRYKMAEKHVSKQSRVGQCEISLHIARFRPILKSQYYIYNGVACTKQNQNTNNNAP